MVPYPPIIGFPQRSTSLLILTTVTKLPGIAEDLLLTQTSSNTIGFEAFVYKRNFFNGWFLSTT